MTSQVLTEENQSKLRRFITLIDVLVSVFVGWGKVGGTGKVAGTLTERRQYEKNVKVSVRAAAAPVELYQPSSKNVHRDEDFAWDRAVSRLTEMQSDEYLASQWQGGVEFLRTFRADRLDEKELGRIWARYDVDNDGSLSEVEMHRFLLDTAAASSTEKTVTEQNATLLARAIDSNGDGQITFVEFRGYWRKHDSLFRPVLKSSGLATFRHVP